MRVFTVSILLAVHGRFTFLKLYLDTNFTIITSENRVDSPGFFKFCSGVARKKFVSQNRLL